MSFLFAEQLVKARPPQCQCHIITIRKTRKRKKYNNVSKNKNGNVYLISKWAKIGFQLVHGLISAWWVDFFFCSFINTKKQKSFSQQKNNKNLMEIDFFNDFNQITLFDVFS